MIDVLGSGVIVEGSLHMARLRFCIVVTLHWVVLYIGVEEGRMWQLFISSRLFVDVHCLLHFLMERWGGKMVRRAGRW